MKGTRLKDKRSMIQLFNQSTNPRFDQTEGRRVRRLEDRKKGRRGLRIKEQGVRIKAQEKRK